MKKLYKIVLIIVSIVLGFVAYKNPINFEDPSALPVFIYCLWFSITNITIAVISFNKELLLAYAKDSEFNLQIMFGCIAVIMLFISISFYFFVLSETEWVRWIFSLIFFLLAFLTGWFGLINSSIETLSTVTWGSFYVFPVLSLVIQMLFKFEHPNNMILSVSLFFVAFLVFLMRRDDELNFQRLQKEYNK